jgi:hypothetical protein
VVNAEHMVELLRELAEEGDLDLDVLSHVLGVNSPWLAP